MNLPSGVFNVVSLKIVVVQDNAGYLYYFYATSPSMLHTLFATRPHGQFGAKKQKTPGKPTR